MTMFIIQSAFLLAIAFILGCILGCLLRWFFGRGGSAGVNSSQPAPVDASDRVATSVQASPPSALVSGSKTDVTCRRCASGNHCSC